jgi:hypothetical protein
MHPFDNQAIGVVENFSFEGNYSIVRATLYGS